ncbi:MAG: hypothetical protein WAW80_03000 [Candidatus Saccharimonadales bacterium]
MASYNCNDSSNSAYGDGNFGTCTSQSVNAPNTGLFQEIIGGGTFTILAPLAVAVVVVVIASLVIQRHKKSSEA